MADTFVDFKQVKQQVSMESALGRYNIRLRRVNQHSLRGACPLPSHSSDKSKESFIVQTDKNIYVCQSNSCVAVRNGKKGGNILDFVALMEQCSIRDAAVKLRDWFLTTKVYPESGKGSGIAPPPIPETNDEGENKPLAFTLNGIDHTHAYLQRRGIKQESAVHFGTGFFPGKGSMSGRVVIPVHNESGELVAYAGRTIDQTEPKYKLPAGFKKSVVLFNLHRVLKLPEQSRRRVIICEGFFDCFKVHQAGLPAVVGLMGSSLSDAQEKLLRTFRQVILFLDGDEAGREAAKTVASRLTHQTFVRVIDLPDGRQPDQLSSQEIKAILGNV